MRIDKVSIREEYATDLCNKLSEKCFEYDGFKNYSFVNSNEYDFELPESENPYCYLVYDDSDELIAFLGYVKIDNNNLQVCMAVDPNHRRQRIGTNMFLKLVSEFESCSYSVSLDPKNEIGKVFLEKLGFNFASKELSIALSKDDFSFDCEPIELKIENDVENLDLNIVDENLLKITGLIDETVENQDEPIKKEVGWLYLVKDESAFCLCDIEIQEDYREKGYGNRLLQTTIKDAFKHSDKIILHVSNNNTPAINLYKKIGFKTLETIDIYEI